MSYMKAKYKPKKPPPNPIVVGCLGTLYLVFLYLLSYGILTLLAQRFEQVTPAYLRDALAIPAVLSGDVAGFFFSVPFPDEVILFIEMTLLVVVLLGLSSTLYSFYAHSVREKEGWELYAEEAERQAKMARGKK